MPRARVILLSAVLWLALAGPAAAATGEAAALQVALRALRLYDGSIDGEIGPNTRAAVRAFQSRRGLAVDGVVGPQTRRALGRRGRPRLGARVIGMNDRGFDVAALQFLLARQGFPSGPMDGGFGGRTQASLLRFQRWAGLVADGLAGAGTLSALRRDPPRSLLRFAAPLGVPITDGYGARGVFMHAGVDYAAPLGMAVRAAGRGCVRVATNTSGGFGLTVVIAHRMGMESLYAHLDTLRVKAGDCVVAGMPIGTVGSTGQSTGPHLHFELHVRGAAVNPLTGL